MQIIIHALKYDEMMVVGDLLGTRLAELFRDTLLSLQLNVLTAVPLHLVRLRERGYNFRASSWVRPSPSILTCPFQPVC